MENTCKMAKNSSFRVSTPITLKSYSKSLKFLLSSCRLEEVDNKINIIIHAKKNTWERCGLDYDLLYAIFTLGNYSH